MTLPIAQLRVAVLSRNFSPTAGGAERYSIALVEQLAARHEIHVFAQSVEHQWPGVRYHLVSMPLRRPRWFNQLWFASASWWATRKGFDVVHSHENTWHGNVQTVHVLPVKHNLFHGLTGWRRLLRWCKVLSSPRLVVYLLLERMRYALQAGRCVILTSQSLLSIFSTSYPDALPMTRVLTPGIDLPTLPSQSERALARQSLGLPLDKDCILFVGNDFRKKGLQTLIDAMSSLAGDSILAVVGSSRQLAAFRQQVERAGLTSRVFFLGAMKTVSPAYLAADCLAHPTLEDTFAMVVLEAMAHGLPVVVSSERYCGISGLLKHEKNALILDDPRDVRALAQSLKRIFADSALKASLSLAARDFSSHFEWEKIADQQEEIYRQVSQGGLQLP